jgi:tRNA-splicing ligase RtcB
MQLKQIEDCVWQLPKEGGMKVPALFVADNELMEQIKKDKTIEQAKNVTFLPGIQKHGITLPDAHQGYGFPIGGVAALDAKEGAISPGGVGLSFLL